MKPVEEITIRGTGLLPTPYDDRDYSLGAVYGVIDIKDVPIVDWMVADIKTIKDQKKYDFCAGFMVASISEDQEDEALGGLWQFAAIKSITGDYLSWGSDLRSAMLSTSKIGSIPEKKQDAYLKVSGSNDRDWLADIRNWPPAWLELAKKYAKYSLFAVKGPYDAFDNVRAAMWQHRDEKCSVASGVLWRYSWESDVSAIIPDKTDGDGEGHAIKICGQKTLNGEIHLVLQNSWGNKIGDKGFFYVNRKVFNREFGPYGFFMLKDLPKEVAQYLNENELTVNNSWWVHIWVFLKGLFT